MRPARCDFHLVDAKEEFAADYLFPVLKAGAIYERDYLLGTSTARPLIAQKAGRDRARDRLRRARARLHRQGQRSGPLRARLQALAPELADRRAVARMGHRLARGRDRLRRRARDSGAGARRRIRTRATATSGTSPTKAGRSRTRRSSPRRRCSSSPSIPRTRRTSPEKVTIAFEEGIPVAVDGVKRLAPVDARRDAQRDRRAARRRPRGHRREPPDRDQVARRVRDAGRDAARLGAAGARIASRSTATAAHEKERIATRYAELVYNGQWFSPLREASTRS